MNILKKLRTDAGKLQKDIAEYLGVDRTTYLRYEKGDTEPDTKTLQKLADYFGVTVDYLLGREIKKTTNMDIGGNSNVIKIASRDGGVIERNLTDEQLALFRAMLEQLNDSGSTKL